MSIQFTRTPSDNSLTFKVVFNSAPDLVLDFTFESLSDGFQLGEGKTFFTSDPAGGYISPRFIPKAKVTGSILVDGKVISADGHGLFVHAVQVKPFCVGRWNFLNFQAGEDALLMYQYEMPDGYDYEIGLVNQGCLVRNNKIVAVLTSNTARHISSRYDDFSGYHVPTSIEYIWSGTTTDGTNKPVQIEMTVHPKNLCDKIDMLAELPYLLRMVIQTFVTRPFVYEWFEDAVAKVTVGEEKFEIKGKAFVETVFLMDMGDAN
ncbi:putative cell survival pathways protein [Quaeritorhiza haematococci]|nr:putative cell survival pathways protein [Quaeritorhiza haematococci]